MNKILVTGGAGYIGSILLRRLLANDYSVVCLDNLKFGGNSLIDVWSHPEFEFHKCDITDFNAVDNIFKKDTYWGIVHLAAVVGDPACKLESDLAKKVNWDASVHLLEKAINKKVERFIFASTCSNYGKMSDPDGFVYENSELSPISLYAKLKVKFENLMLNEIPRQSNFCPTSLRFATVYGLSNRMRFDLTVNEFTKELAMGKELVVYGEQFWRPYCHVNDFSRAILTVLKTPKETVAYDCFNVGDTNENYTKQMIINELEKQIPNAKIKYVQKKDDPRDYRVNFDKINKALGFNISKSVPDGIKEIKQIIELEIIKNPEAQKYYNIPHNKK